jgi:hypothetical protein
MSKAKPILFMIFTLMCFIAAGICLIVDFALTRSITWSGISIASIVLGWFIICPLLFNKFQIPLSLATLSVVIFPYLWYIARITSPVSWFSTLGIPIGIIGIAFIWIIYLLFRLIKIHILYKSAVAVFLSTVIASPIINHIVAFYTVETAPLLQDIVNIFAGITVTALLAIWGYKRTHQIKNPPV